MRGRTEAFKQEIVKSKRLGPEHNIWFWNPNNPVVRKAPAWFLERLQAEMGDELDVTWNPIEERWQVWSRAPRINTPVCQGWRLLFVHNGPSGGYLPLDERLYARLWSCSADQHGDGRKYFARIESEWLRDQERKDERARQDAIDQAMPYFEHSKIKNIGKGSKFSTYHA